MKKLTALLVALVFVLSACSNDGTSQQKNKNNDKTEDTSKNYAVINGYEVKKSEYDKYYDLYLNMIAKQNKLEENVKDMFVDDAILKTELEKNNIKVTEEDIENTYQNMIDDMGGKENYDKMLEENHIPDELYKKFSEIQAYREAHRDWYISEHPISEDEIAKYYEENKGFLEKYNVSHILVDTVEECKEIKAKLDAGEDFATLAKECSSCPSKDAGGDLGEIAPDSPTYDKDFLEAMKGLEEGQVSEPVNTQFGWHLIKVNSVKKGAETFKDEIEKAISNDAYIKYYTEIKDAADIKMENEE